MEKTNKNVFALKKIIFVFDNEKKNNSSIFFSEKIIFVVGNRK